MIYFFFFFFFNDTATTEIYTLSLHDSLPISIQSSEQLLLSWMASRPEWPSFSTTTPPGREGHSRSEEHTSELQSRSDLVCRLLLEKKKKNIYQYSIYNKNILTYTRAI